MLLKTSPNSNVPNKKNRRKYFLPVYKVNLKTLNALNAGSNFLTNMHLMLLNLYNTCLFLNSKTIQLFFRLNFVTGN
jgi:hypothetical protein